MVCNVWGDDSGGGGYGRRDGGGGCERGKVARGILADGVEGCEVDGGAEAGAQGRGQGAAPERREEALWGGAQLGEGGAERVFAGLLDAGLEEIDRL